MLNKIFIAKKLSKYPFDPMYSKVLYSGFDRVDFERDRELKLLQNLFSLKLDQEHIDKSSLLLYNCRKTRNYPLKRKYLKNTVYNYDKDNNLYITFPKFKSVGKTMTIDALPQKRNKYFITDKNTLDDDNFESLRQKINADLENNFRTIPNNDDYEDMEKGRKLYKLLRTKYPYHTIDNNDNNFQSLPKIQNKNIEDKKLLKRIMDIDPVLGSNIYQNKVKLLTKKQQLNLLYLNELDVFNSMDKLNIKREMLNKSKNKSVKKEKLLIQDLFYYDKEKWRKINREKNYNENEAKIDEYNAKNKNKLINMKNTIEKLQAEKVKTEMCVKETLSNIDQFLQKNPNPLNVRYPSDKTQKRFRAKSENK